MRFQHAFIPYRGYWSTPFCRWQGSFSRLHPLALAAETARRALAERAIPTDAFDGLVLGTTVPSKHGFYGSSWVAGLIGATGIAGPAISQACATSARVIAACASEVELDPDRCLLGVTADRTSNGPHLVWADPGAPGATPVTENWVWDNFGCDPYAGGSMIQTADRVAAEAGISTEEQHDIALLRHLQYQAALADGAAFHRRYMIAPIDVPLGGRKVATVTTDEGVRPATADSLARLAPVAARGSVTQGGQTHPADGNAGLVVTGPSRARALGRDGVVVQLLAFGEARAEPGYMPRAVVPAARRALADAGLDLGAVAAIQTHNPFAVNDAYFCRETGVQPEALNAFGSSLVWGHPQAPTGMRSVIELIETLALRGGGIGLFTGCTAGDGAAALVLRVA
ncbi:acetyl-CoA acetyltransferase [bacterium]|nr:thiolase family protein [Chloroflexi bacterium CFX6]RIL12473.1 MAG: acetyl-CoA acetyltransferase [bacterium]